MKEDSASGMPMMVKPAGTMVAKQTAPTTRKASSCTRPSTPMARHLPNRMREGFAETTRVSITREVFSEATDIATP